MCIDQIPKSISKKKKNWLVAEISFFVSSQPGGPQEAQRYGLTIGWPLGIQNGLEDDLFADQIPILG